MLSILDRSLLKELLSNMVFTLVVITSIFFTVGAVELLHKWPGIDPALLLQALPFLFLSQMEFVLPLSLLIAVVTAFGRAAAHLEVTAIKAAGIHPYRLLLPAFWIAGLASLATLYVTNQVSPRAMVMFKARMASQSNLRMMFEASIETQARLFDGPELMVKWDREEFPPEGGLVLHDVFVVQKAQSGSSRGKQAAVDPVTINAKRLELRFDAESDVVELRPFDGTVLEGPHKELQFRGELPAITVSLGMDTYSQRLKYRTGTELIALYQRARDGLHPFRGDREILATLHSRASLATASLFFVLIAAPLAWVFRAGSRLVAFLLSFLIVLFVFYPAHLASKTLSEHEILPPVLAAWSGNLLLGAFGIGLLTFVVRR